MRLLALALALGLALTACTSRRVDVYTSSIAAVDAEAPPGPGALDAASAALAEASTFDRFTAEVARGELPGLVARALEVEPSEVVVGVSDGTTELGLGGAEVGLAFTFEPDARLLAADEATGRVTLALRFAAVCAMQGDPADEFSSGRLERLAAFVARRYLARVVLDDLGWPLTPETKAEVEVFR